MQRSGGGSLFHARGPAAAKDRSPSDDIVRGTATELDAADLTPGLTVAAADGMIRSAEMVRRRISSDVPSYTACTRCAV